MDDFEGCLLHGWDFEKVCGRNQLIHGLAAKNANNFVYIDGINSLYDTGGTINSG